MVRDDWHLLQAYFMYHHNVECESNNNKNNNNNGNGNDNNNNDLLVMDHRDNKELQQEASH